VRGVADDPFIWLEEVEGEAALDWVRRQNERSLAHLEADPRYAELHRDALAVVTAADRIPYPSFRGSQVANFWQDDAHQRGLWRRTTLDSYLTETPEWETVLDIDALAAAEDRAWVYHGASYLPPDYRQCLVNLSDGGKDADEAREFDARDRQFVDAGFFLPEGKQSATWIDADTLLVGRDWGPGTMTASGYPYIIKRWQRGTPLESAAEVFRGSADDVSVRPVVLRDPDGQLHGILVFRAVTFFESEAYLLGDAGPVRLPIPLKSQFREFVLGQLIFTLDEAWDWRGRTYQPGALVALDLDRCKRGAEAIEVVQIYAPGPRESIEGVTATRSRLLVTIYREVRGRAVIYEFTGALWRETALPLPENASVYPISTNDRDERAFVSVMGYLIPDTLYLADLATAAANPVKSLPPRFDAGSLAVEQFEATSQDGTQVPYFVVHPKAMSLDGTTPTLLYGYGGFQISLTPSYVGIPGKLWLERGGAYVVANIRGGGEFGPTWHQAALKQHRQRAYDDFIAVAEDLIRRGITTPRRLGIMGGSNGGLLMGAMLVQRPDLFRAIVIQVPLLDMLRYHKLLAGASWMAEYGDPEQSEEGEFLRHISPYHNLRPGVAYPEPFFVTSTRDDRVHPGHARKMAAKLAAMGLPFLYYENVEGGHSAAATLQERARRQALEFTYLAQKLMD
jgi:prolyl oligopeptidase